eukprot:CAMPEP_0175073296 /NCGR_PEP_ID=MMETSP0052_2-20121109/20454_1 /TAXON_ID=51329 ORGANISM="Polytomella parva, Strain SAG 63-3" /NCGR_SAMPLE_ID=MMETSP0052_2 /ASSEMBLY_ACC=CAM_ASM_000194 /LENGTH=83 /DNA_ID=CAMNT_0016341031 /DNA_START=606 /DNA_END=857 /DNA_ORIENTATION=-
MEVRGCMKALNDGLGGASATSRFSNRTEGNLMPDGEFRDAPLDLKTKHSAGLSMGILRAVDRFMAAADMAGSWLAAACPNGKG